MKKFIMTAIVICLSIATAIPFHSTKAMSQVRPEVNKTLTWNGVSVGWYNHYAYLTSGSGEVINTSQFGVGPVGYYKTVDVITVGFNDPYSGEIMFGFTGSLSNYQLVYIDGENTGSYRWSGSNQVLYVSFDNCLSFDIYMYSTTQYTNSNLPTKIDTYAFTELSLYSLNNGSSYTVPLESIPAYIFPCNTMPELSYLHGDIYPYIHIDSGDQELQHSKLLLLNDTNYGNKMYWVFMSRNVIYDTDYTIQKSDNSISDTLTTVMQLSPRYITGLNTDDYLVIYRFEFYGSGNIEIWWNKDLDIIPIYLGKKGNCPSNYWSICGFGGDPITSIAGDMNEISTIIDAIYTLLLTNAGDQGQTSQDIGDLADDFGDIADDEHQISSGFQDNLDDFNELIDLQDYDFLTGIANASEYFKIQLENVFNNSVNLRAMWVLPVICIVLLKLLGG